MDSKNVYFYQQKGYIRHIKRFKKLPEQLPASLRNFINAKNNAFKNKGKYDENNVNSKSGEFAANSVDSFDMGGNTAGSIRQTLSSHQSASQYASYTDVKLKSLRSLTENLLLELQEYLNRFLDANMRPVLDSEVINDLHSDWTDLTQNVSYENFPEWHTKTSRDAHVKGPNDKGRTTSIDDDMISLSSAASRKHSARKNSATASVASPVSHRGRGPSQNTTNATSKKPEKRGFVPQPLDPITEEKRRSVFNNSGMESSLNRTEHRKESVAESLHELKNMRSNMSRRTSAVPKPLAPIEPVKHEHSRHDGSQSTGFSVNFQLSEKACEAKGWTILSNRIDHEPEELERRAQKALRNALKEIDELRMKNERLELTKFVKVRFYGDRKKEQLEKYKSSSLKPKKSLFAMAILRKELPRPIDYESIVDSMYSSAHLNTSGLNTSTSFNEEMFGKTVCSTHTNDGTSCIFYPNGRLAIISANVFGFYLDTLSFNLNANNSTILSNSQLANNSSSSNLQANAAAANNVASTNNLMQQSVLVNSSFANTSNAGFNNLVLGSHHIADSYTTLVFDDVPKTRENVTSSYGSKLGHIEQNVAEGRLLAVITASGACVCYRKNGQPKFICTDSRGILCDNKGISVYQWKWDDMKSDDVDRVKRELKIQLNDTISLDYRNPSSITLKYISQKENIELQLGCTKFVLNKLNDLLNRCATENIVFQSTLAIKYKINRQLKGSHLQPYKTHHLNQRKQSINEKKEVNEGKIIDKLLENTVYFKDIEQMKELLQIQKRIRSIIDEWLSYCRHALGVLSPEMYLFPDTPSYMDEKNPSYNKILIFRRKSKSADLRRTHRPRTTASSMSMHRSRSGLIKNFGSMKNLKLSDRIDHFRKQISMANLATEIGNKRSHNTRAVNTAAPREKPTINALLSGPFNEQSIYFKTPRGDNGPTDGPCPISVRHRILFDRKIECKCKRNSVPLICDIEFDRFIKIMPPDQLLVVAIIKSYENSLLNTEALVAQLYEAYNKSRARPCTQSALDDVRFLFYDIETASNGSNHVNPLLVQRHNVIPGMVMIYENGKLIFCDHIFNGYGCSLSDFVKQLNQSKEDAKNGKFLPYNFRFVHPKGLHGNRTAWGGEIGGLIILDKESKSFYSQSLDSFTGREPNQAYSPKKNKFVYKSENITLPKIKSSLEV